MRAALLSFVVPGLLLFAPAAGAHVPHDVVHRLALSPAFAEDQTLLAFIQLSDHQLLARSTDGGRSFTEFGAPMIAHGLVDFAFSPQYASDSTLFAATAKGGVFRSLDGGLVWEATNTGLASLVVHDVAISPDFATDSTLLAGTDAGLWRSTDAGDSWHAAGAGAIESLIGRVAFAADDAQVVVYGDRVLHRSSDGGLNGVPVVSFIYRIGSIAFAPDGVAALSFQREPGGVQLSLDGGLSWAPMHAGLTDQWVNSVAIAEDGTFFAATRTAGCFRAEGLGQPWQLLKEGFEVLSDQTSNHFLEVVPSPAFARDERVFMGAFEGLFASADRGETWVQADLYHQRINRRLVLSPDFTADGFIWAGNYGGGPTLGRAVEMALAPQLMGVSAPVAGPLSVSGPGVSPPATAGPPLSAGRRVIWEARANGIGSLHTDTLAISPTFARDRTLFYGYQGFWRSQNAGLTWTSLAPSSTITRALALSPSFAQDRMLFLGTAGTGTFRSDDAGESFTELTDGLPADLVARCFALAPAFPSDPKMFLATEAHGLFRSLDGGTSWHAVATVIGSDTLRAVAFSPAFGHDQLVLAGSVGEGLQRSDDGGTTWTKVSALLPPGGNDIIQSIAFSAAFASDRTVFVASQIHGVLRSTDGAASFQSVQAGLPIDAPRVVCVSPGFAQDQTVFVATHDWIWRSFDRGDTWERLPGYARIDDHHHAVIELGLWASALSPGAHGPGVRRSVTPGASAEVRVLCDSLAFHAPRGPDAGIVQILVDGQQAAFVDLYAPTPVASQPVFVRNFPKVDWRSLTLVVTGSKNQASSGIAVRSDGFTATY